ncbi:carboxypeptidase M32 [Halobacillus andaensis]|uniref:Metal-dependent carboxypeptidase n=1 Tax=Halobacillus andaensis TaxID=1176239 RepID=A0A917ETH5_HALAA|nr:carboxypeptidase M32 [Halobacillus andaensis]MBP2003313.1 carboxypeptidase Taq [Halobacillus andaensis]GGF09725.1 carboxypeptidase M32 [Halobacillus andaensis]
MSFSTEQKFWNLLKEQSSYEEAIGLMAWDMRTKAPKKGVENRSEVIGVLSQKVHEIQTCNEIKLYIDELKKTASDPKLIAALREAEETYHRTNKIPTQLYKEFVTLQTTAESKWAEAKENNDFESFQPYLEELVRYNREFAELWGYEDHIYDALLHNYEPGVTVKQLDQVFPKVRDELAALLTKIQESEVSPDPAILQGHFPKHLQEAFSEEILKRMSYDFDAGRLDETIHPFAIGLNTNDVRVTTKYDERDFRTAVFGTIHEGGHALYEQNIDPDLSFTPLATGTSMGIHESQSLFWENFIARSREFWENHYSLFQSHAPDRFKQVSFDDFFLAVNEVKPSLIRIEADELTYCLHIMVRYELEKALINGEIEVKQLPELWNEKMKTYLGVVPDSDSTGVLQDIHWAGGDFGYFPSYALGYMYAAQFDSAMRKDVNVSAAVRSGDFQLIKNWLSNRIHQYGKMKKPLDILEEVTGEGLNPNDLVNYLRNKYKHIYRF